MNSFEGTASSQNRNSVASLQDISQELTMVLTRLFDIMYPAAVLFGGLALAASVYRSLQYGWYGTLYLHVGMYFTALVILIIRRRLPVLLIFSIMLGMIFTEVIHSLYHRGLASSGMMNLAILATFTGIFLGKRAGITVVAAGAVLTSLVGMGFCTGMLTIGLDANEYLATPIAWIVNISCLIMYVIPLILAVNGMQRRIASSLRELKDTASSLKSEVSTRKQVEKELRISEEKYRNLFENAVEGIFQTTPEGRISNGNPALARMLGYASPDELTEMIDNLGKQVYAREVDRLRFLSQLQEKGVVEGMEVQMCRKDGSVIWTSMNTRAVTDGSGALVRIDGTLEDVTRRKSVEQALLESEAKYRSVVESSLAGFYIIQDEQFRFINNRFCEITGYTDDEVVNRMHFLDLIHPDDRPRVLKNVERRLSRETDIIEYDFRAVRKDREVITVRVFGGYSTYGGRPALCGTFVDITRERQMEAQLRQAQKMEAIGTLAGGIAHDFNNILTALIGYGTMLQCKMEETNPLRLYTDQILSASHKAVSLTQSLLTFGRKRPLSLKPVNLNSIIGSTEKLLKRLITEDILLEVHLAEDALVVMADSTQIDQILFNLTTNARDAMPRGGVLQFTTTTATLDEDFILSHGFGEKGLYALLTVTDTGLGMGKTTLEKIFDPFFTTKEVGRGTGLGLSTVYGIVKQHRGYITVTSEPDRGTSFRLYFPLAKTAAEAERPASMAFRHGSETILVAEDNDDVRGLVKDILEDYGYTVIEAADGEEAVARFREGQGIDLVILDSIMPRMNGREAYETIRATHPTVRFLFMSGHTADTVLEKGIHEGEFDFLPKPLEPRELLEKLRDIFDRSA